MSTHHGYIAQFPWIRCDAFDSRPNPYTHTSPLVHLLTHAHTDHFAGLDSPAWDGVVYCTAVTKELVLGAQTAAERVRHMLEPQAARKFKFANLRGADRRGGKRLFCDRIRVIEYDTPITVDGPDGLKASITAIDANHCPGSATFLINSLSPAPPCAILITGDIRAEPRWVESLRRNPSLAPYLASPVGSSPSGAWRSTLDCIYLDTSSVLRDEQLLSKQEAIDHFLECAKRYPADTKFFLNAWTWGYEDLLVAVHRTFKTKIHLDSYKHRLYGSSAIQALDRTLSILGTKSELGTRFHACERRLKCSQCYGDGRGCYDVPSEQLTRHLKGRLNKGPVVYVNPVEIGRGRWEEYKKTTDVAFAKGELPNYLMVPFARHSTLPELKAFVGLFQPHSIYPLVISPSAVEYTALGDLFREELPASAPDRIASEAREYLRTQLGRRAVFPSSSREVERDEGEWVGVIGGGGWQGNVEGGEEVEELLGRWARETSRNAKRKFVDVDEEEGGEGGRGGREGVKVASNDWASDTPDERTSSALEPAQLLPSPELFRPPTLPTQTRAAPTPPIAPLSIALPTSLLIQPSPLTRTRRQSLTAALQRALSTFARGAKLGPAGSIVAPSSSIASSWEDHSTKRMRMMPEEESPRRDRGAWGGFGDSFRTVPPTPEQLRRA